MKNPTRDSGLMSCISIDLDDFLLGKTSSETIVF